jgi:hypothetical protein
LSFAVRIASGGEIITVVPMNRSRVSASACRSWDDCGRMASMFSRRTTSSRASENVGSDPGGTT